MIATSKEVGIKSREHVAFEDVNMICLTSAVVAGTKLRRAGGVTAGGECGDRRDAEEKEADSLLILSPKKSRKDVESSDAEEKVGTVGSRVRAKSELRLDHSFLGFLEF